MQIQRIPILLLGLMILVLGTGCSDDSVAPPPPDNGQIFASTVEKLMQNFSTSFTRLDDVSYTALLDNRFKFYYEYGTDHDYATEVRITENMFSGNPPTNTDPGSTNSGIRSVDVDKILPLESWQPVSASHPDFGGIAGAKRGFYDVVFIFHHDAGTITVSCTQFFYAVPVTTMVGGEAKTEWKLLGQEDIGNKVIRISSN